MSQRCNGYVRVVQRGHHRADTRGRVYEHIIVMERILGRPLVKGENVHHKNCIRHDNRPENLELWTTQQPNGARIKDKIDYALEILNKYKPEALKDGVL